jgi:tetratricopeptide (TPR) repeat protein
MGGTGYSAAMMPDTSHFMAALRRPLIVVLALSLAGCARQPQKPEEEVRAMTRVMGESEALMAAEISVREGDCRGASENYLAAAMASKEVRVASRAAQIALGCHQLETARAATRRWRELDEWDGDASLAAALVALKRYDLKEAGAALTAWRDSGSAGNQDPLAFAEGISEEADATALYRVFGAVLVGEDPAPEVLLAQARLEFAAQNMGAARRTAQRAVDLDNRLLEARTIVLRSQSVLGEHNAAIAGARELGAFMQGEEAFLLADLLDAAGRDQEADDELQRLLAQPESRGSAQRRLVAMALRNGDLEGAEQQLTQLMGDGNNAVAALLYFAQLAERRGDDARAIQSYRLLADTPVGLTARAAAARLLIKRGDSKSALALVDEYAAQNPDAALEAGATRASLLAEAGELAAALEGLDALDKEYPDYPDLQYTRATVLESGGRTRDSVAELERALKARPDDVQLLNALGFTLADHKQRLPHAEQLIRSALAVSPDNPAIQDSLGWVLYKRGKRAEALPILARAWQNSGDGEIAAHYGEVLWKSGDEGKARYIWQQALNSYPAHPGLLRTVKQMTGEDVAAR